jgi:hypothetical protein
MKFTTKNVLRVFESHASFIFWKTFYEWVTGDPTGGKGLIKMERRLNEFSSRLSSQLCDIEKKINVYSDRLADIENIINDLILPSIQEVGRMVSHSPKNKNKNTQEVFIKLNNKINDFLINQKQQLKYRNQLSLDNIDYSPQNGSP